MMNNLTPQELMSELQKPFKVEEIGFKVTAMTQDKSKGLVAAYVNNSAIQQRLDEVFGPFGWQVEFKEWKSGKAQICKISVWNGKQWISKEDGAGDTDFEAIKGGISDSMKRCARMFGIGRYLCNDNCVINPWAVLENKRITKAEMTRLRNEYNQILIGTGAASKPQQQVDITPNNISPSTSKKTTNPQIQSTQTNLSQETQSQHSHQLKTKLPDAMIKVLKNLISLNKADLKGILEFYKADSIEYLTMEQANDALKRMASNKNQ